MKQETNTQNNSDEKRSHEQTGSLPPSQTPIDEPRKDTDFYKVNLSDFLKTIEPLANQKTKICYWIIRKMNQDNYLHATFRQIATETNASYGTVAETMKQLQKNNFICKINSGRYIVNPDIVFQGAPEKCTEIQGAYQDALKAGKMTSDEKQLREYQKQIDKLKKQAISLKKKIDIINSDNHRTQ
ncbi:MAG: replication/maintenance protein RepL [Lachnospiraceae bacterium]|nr:replication/maintenance protein RepL [Lachnospiraceae bacterium]